MAPKKKELSAAERQAKKQADEEKKETKKAADLKLEIRRQDELNMWLAGGTYRAIAAQISKRGEKITKSTVEKDIKLLLQQDAQEGKEFNDQLKLKNYKRIETLILSHWQTAQKDKDIGKLVAGLIKQENELFGINSPTKHEHDFNFNPKDCSDEELQSIANSGGKG